MNRKVCLGLAVLLIMVLVAGCGGGAGQAPQKPAEAPKEAPKEPAKPSISTLRLGIGSMGGTYHYFATVLIPVLEKMMPGVSIGTVPGGDYGGMMGLLKGDRDTAWCFAPSCLAAYEGTTPFTEKNPNVRFVASFYDTYLQIITKKGSNIRTLADLKGKKLGVGTPQQIQAYLLPTLLEYYGLSYDKIKESGGSVSWVGYEDGVSMVQDGTLDAYQLWNAYPWSTVMSADTAVGIDLVSLDDAAIEHFLKKYPQGFRKWVIPKGTYSGQTKDCTTLALTYVLTAHKDLPDDVVYTICKGIYDDPSIWAELVKGYPTGITLDRALLGYCIPMHPGAERYYKEKGLMK